MNAPSFVWYFINHKWTIHVISSYRQYFDIKLYQNLEVTLASTKVSQDKVIKILL